MLDAYMQFSIIIYKIFCLLSTVEMLIYKVKNMQDSMQYCDELSQHKNKCKYCWQWLFGAFPNFYLGTLFCMSLYNLNKCINRT